MTIYGKCGICKQYGKACGCPDNHDSPAVARRKLAASRKKAAAAEAKSGKRGFFSW